MTPQELAKVAAKLPVSKDVAALSLGQLVAAAPEPLVFVHPGKRIKQDSKPLMNKLEAAWLAVLAVQHPGVKVWSQTIRFRLANGLWYKPDHVSFELKTCWECKGLHAFRGGFENLKSAASLYPELRWVLVWKDNGQWKEQVVLP